MTINSSTMTCYSNYVEVSYKEEIILAPKPSTLVVQDLTPMGFNDFLDFLDNENSSLATETEIEFTKGCK